MSNYIYYNQELYHHGIKGQKWGVRRFQNPDGTLTALGKQRLGQLGKVAKVIAPKTYNSFKKYKAPKKLNYKGATVTAGVRTATGVIDNYARQQALAGMAMLAGGAYVLTGSNPYVKKGLMIAGVLVHTKLTANSIDFYASQGISTVKDFMRATENYKKNRKKKEKA